MTELNILLVEEHFEDIVIVPRYQIVLKIFYCNVTVFVFQTTYILLIYNDYIMLMSIYADLKHTFSKVEISG